MTHHSPKCEVLAILIALAGCAANQRAPKSPVVRTADRPSRTVSIKSISAEQFISKSGSYELLIIRASQLALTQSQSARVRDIAATMIDQHKGTSAQLSFAGRRLNLLPSPILKPSEQGIMDRLASSRQFDLDYVKALRAIHQDAAALDWTYGTTGTSPTLRQYAAAAAAVEQRHLRLLTYL